MESNNPNSEEFSSISTHVENEIKKVLQILNGKVDISKNDLPTIKYSERDLFLQEVYFAQGGVILPEEGVVVIKSKDCETNEIIEISISELSLDDKLMIYGSIYKK